MENNLTNQSEDGIFSRCLLQEEENFLRLCVLMFETSSNAVRALFDSIFDPSCLHTTMNREYNKLINMERKLNKKQWSSLFPFKGRY